MKIVSRPVIILAMLALAACGGSDDTSPGDGVTPPPGGGTPASAPGITAQPAAQSVIAPAVASFSVTASGTGPLSYQWRSSANGTDWTAIGGATDANYQTGATSADMDGRYYSVVVSNSAGSVASASAKLTVQSASPPGPSGEFPHTATPLAVTATRAAGAVSSFYITSSRDAAVQVPDGAAGLTVDSGVTVSLGFPGNAFLEDQSLAVTRVTLAGIDGQPLPFQSVIGAFDLAPPDPSIPELQANNLVRITFTLTPEALDAAGAGQLVIFSARADGSELHLVPVSADGGTWSALTLATRVAHLGIFGLATLDSAQAATLATAWPHDDLQLEAAVAPASYELRKAALPGGAAAQAVRMRPMAAMARAVVQSAGDDWAAQLQARLDAYYNDVVVPALNAADAPNADLAQFRAATQEILAWERMRQLFDLQDGRDAGLTQKLHDYVLRGLDKAMQDCSANRNGAATVQVLSLARQAELLGIQTDISLQQVLDTCGRSTYDVSVDWTQVHTEDLNLKNDVAPETAFTGTYQSTVTIGGKLHLASTPELTSVSIDQSLSAETNCAPGAWRCEYQKYSITAHDTDPGITRCGGGFFGSSRVERWNLDARGHLASPTLSVTFQNSFGCASSSFVVATGRATKTSYDQNGNTSQTTASASDSVNTAPWSGTARLGSTSRIVRSSSELAGLNVVPGSTQRWTTSLTFKITEVTPTN